MSSDYPKSPQELLTEIDTLNQRTVILEAMVVGLRQDVARRDAEIAVLRRRKPPRVLDPSAKDSFQRPISR